MRRARLALFVTLFAALPLSAYAQSDVIDWLEGLSGPGPYHNKGRGYEWNLFCYPINLNCYANDGIDYFDDSGKSDAKFLVKFANSFADTGTRQLFQDDTLDVRNVKETQMAFALLYRASRIVDIGAGVQILRFSSDDGAAFNFTRTGWVPYRVTVTPFGLIPATSQRAKFARRLVHVQAEGIWFSEGLSGANFNNPRTRFSVGSEYQTRLALLIDMPAVVRVISGK